MERKCYSCKEYKDIDLFSRDKDKKYGRAYICKKCKHAKARTPEMRAYQKEYRKTHRKKITQQIREWEIRNKDKKRAHGLVRQALKSGKLKRLPCVVCGSPVSSAHHSDYSKPLFVVWLCEPHHRQYHRKF